jgi:hypothetical protein
VPTEVGVVSVVRWVALVEVDVHKRGSGVVCALRWVPPGSGD